MDYERKSCKHRHTDNEKITCCIACSSPDIVSIDDIEESLLSPLTEKVKRFIDEQRAAGKTDSEIDDMLHDDDERRHADRVEKEDRERLQRGY